ncbi:acylphosphatase [Corticicoccus populi]|uniref:acylphosphatase n=1 Tax=Corticicoccus populi TaxID=1812821 RepID=A0ABW5WSQ6_9STAP
MKAKLVIVTGKVQAVGFRFSTKMIADDLDIKGYAKNVQDYVEILGVGEDEKLNQFVNKVIQGASPSSRVDDYSVKEVSVDESYKKFYTN